jgi:CBS-domain-containing membrane protein
MDRQFRNYPRQYLVQAGLATGTLAAVLVVEDVLSNAALITAIAASAFLVFIGPGERLASSRRVIGGHLVGCCVGLLGALALSLVEDQAASAGLLRHLVAATSVGAGIVAMGASNTEHPPAAGTVLGLVLGDRALENALLVMLAVLVIVSVRTVLGRRLMNLF